MDTSEARDEKPRERASIAVLELADPPGPMGRQTLAQGF
jgi:hypothetical protein